MATVIKPPMYDLHLVEEFKFKVFLAGSIEMGKAIDWQSELTNLLENDKVLLFNPRRDDWDSSWEQSINNRHFKQQVVWELDHLDAADLIVFYFDSNTMSPITLMELGLHARTPSRVVVCCPDGYQRKGNVDVVCERFKIVQVRNLKDLADYIRVAASMTPFLPYYDGNRVSSIQETALAVLQNAGIVDKDGDLHPNYKSDNVCTKCGKPYDYLDIEANYKSDGKRVCGDCYFDGFGDFIDQHPHGR